MRAHISIYVLYIRTDTCMHAHTRAHTYIHTYTHTRARVHCYLIEAGCEIYGCLAHESVLRTGKNRCLETIQIFIFTLLCYSLDFPVVCYFWGVYGNPQNQPMILFIPDFCVVAEAKSKMVLPSRRQCEDPLCACGCPVSCSVTRCGFRESAVGQTRDSY